MSAAERYRPEALQAILAKLPAGTCLGIDELAGQLHFARAPLAGMLAALVLDGAIERVEQGCFRQSASASPYAQLPGVDPIAADRRRRARAKIQLRLWRAIRMRQKFTVGDLIRLASKDGDKPIGEAASHYVRCLARAGYLQPLARENGARAQKRWLLVRNTGAGAPVTLRTGASFCVVDPNTGERVPCKR
ncbi:hypothetical protein [Inquilinus sp.]|jgi:hypothetical protein|uniref:hypothetical protein n=1 Tax=Inquilinus sp. TaxID=1932117 RepID=UPI0037842333